MGLKITVQAGRLELDKKLVKAVIRSAGGEIAAVARKLASNRTGAGRFYAIGGGAGHYRASAPGQPPVRLSGTLRNSIKSTVSKSGQTAIIKDPTVYALFLETGARGGGFLKGGGQGKRRNHRKGTIAAGARIVLPRPFLSVALSQRQASIETRIQTAIASGMKFVRVKA